MVSPDPILLISDKKQRYPNRGKIDNNEAGRKSGVKRQAAYLVIGHTVIKAGYF